MTVRIDFRDTSLLSALSDAELSEACRAVLDSVSVKETARVLRAISDEMEMCTDADYWPYPSYGQLLFSVQ